MRRLEDAPSVADQLLWHAVSLDRREDDAQEDRGRLAARDRTGQHGAAVVLEDRNAIDVAAAELVNVEVADVDRTVLVTVVGLERHGLMMVAPFGLGSTQAVQLAIESQNPPAGSGAEIDP